MNYIDLDRVIKLRDLESAAIEAAIIRTGGNVMQARRELGIGRTTLYRKLKKYGLTRHCRVVAR